MYSSITFIGGTSLNAQCSKVGGAFVHPWFPRGNFLVLSSE